MQVDIPPAESLLTQCRDRDLILNHRVTGRLDITKFKEAFMFVCPEITNEEIGDILRELQIPTEIIDYQVVINRMVQEKYI